MSSYWERRAAEDMWEYMEDAEKTASKVARLYRKSSRYLTGQIEDIFETFKNTHGLTDDETQRILNSMHDPADIEELKDKLRQAADSEEKLKLLAEIESPAYQFRINRLNDMQSQISGLMRSVYRQQLDTMTDAGRELCKNVYYKNIYQTQKRTGLGFSFSHIDDKTINKAMNTRWSGKNYSKRIWDTTEMLATELKEELMLNFITGRSNREAAEAIQMKFAKGAHNARRLVRTESCYLANQMEMESYKECDIEKYQFVATLDLRTSEICRNLDGKVFKVSEQKAGVNCPPMHPYCRSTTISYLGKDTLAKLKRRARDPETGESKTVPANMTYKQWYEENVKNVDTNYISQRKNNTKYTITDQAIDKVRKIDIKGHSSDELNSLQQMNKELLRVAKEQNDSNEVVMVLYNGLISKPFMGGQNFVSIGHNPELSSILRTSQMRSVTLSHNHPSLSYFSADDIGIFISYPSIRTMEVVTNQGKTWYISKKDAYDDLKILKEYKKITRENAGEKTDKIVDIFLRKSHNVIERNR